MTNPIGFQVDRAIQQNIENTAAQQDIFQHEQPDVSSSQRVLMVACDGFNRSIMEPDTERIVRTNHLQ